MGYNLTRNSVVRNKPELEELASRRATLLLVTNNPEDLAYKLREAIAAAQEFEEFKRFHDLGRVYSFKTSTKGLIAKYIAPDKVQIVEETPKTQAPKESPQETPAPDPPPAPQLDTRTSQVASTLIDILAVMINEGHEVGEYHFPNARLSETEKLKLWGWTKEKENVGWKFIDSEAKGVSLTKADVPEEMVWQPRQNSTKQQ